MLKQGLRLKVKYNKRQYYFPLGNVVAAGLAKADNIKNDLANGLTMDAVRKKWHPAYVENRTYVPTVADLIKAYTDIKDSLHHAPDTARNYIYALKWIVGKALSLNTQAVTGRHIDLVTTANLNNAKMRIIQGLQDDELYAAMRSFNHYLRNAKALVSGNTLKTLQTVKPDWRFGDLSNALDSICPYNRVANTWSGQSEEQIERVRNAIENLSDPDMYVACVLAFYGGLRKKEVLNAQWSWVRESPSGDYHQIWIKQVGSFRQKGKAGVTCIPKRAWERVKTMFPNPTCTHLIVNPSAGFFKRVNAFIKSIAGWDTPPAKPFHELRRLFGAFVANEFTLFIAQKWLRHNDPKTTYDSYANIILSDECRQLWKT